VLRRAQRIILEFHRIAGSPEDIIDRITAAGMTADVLADQETVGLIGARLAPNYATSER